MYAWSNFITERNDYGQVTNTIKAGDKITKSDLDISDEEWDELVERGVIRKEAYPDIPGDMAPAEAAATEVATEAMVAEVEELTEAKVEKASGTEEK